MSMQAIKILSGWSNPGGSTLHHIALTNLLNEAGYDCTFYGPHEWHRSKCKSGNLASARINERDIVISHFMRTPPLKCRRHILSCHETELFRLETMSLSHYDLVQFVSERQRLWHRIGHPSVVIPPVVERVRWVDPKNNAAGVIGSVDRNKQTHLSIEHARRDGYSKVLLFGLVTDEPYFREHVQGYVSQGTAVLMGHEDNRAHMYSRVQAVYHHSRRETFGLVEAECEVSGIPFFGAHHHPEVLDSEEILRRWRRIL